ncbi:MAG: protoheme IX farnesyltransferase [Bacteroidetes bacterium]|nr:MAG: protoheme IX farnesyltransferase [Bacteroidota bacterium]
MAHLYRYFIAYLRLTKPIITLSVSFSAFTGFILFAGSFASGWFQAYMGVMLIAAGSSALNQVQEADFDKLMDRTRQRPIPSGEVSKRQALAWAILLSVAGAGLLWITTTPMATLLAILTLLWYNGVYTPLKRITPWAILPGALVGAIPPAIGWTAAGGAISHPHIIIVAFFFFIGQIPHFWLILLRHGGDYEKAGFPSITKKFSHNQISRLTFTWTLATAITAIFLPFFGIIESAVFYTVIIILSLALTLSFIRWPGIQKTRQVNRAFMLMNLYFLLMMIIIILDSLLT